MFGHMRLSASQPYMALLVPDTAIVTDAARRVVYAVGREGTVIARPVELGPLVGNLRVIRTGLAANERVIIDGVQRARPGQKVVPKPGRIAASQGPEPVARAAPSTPSSIATPVGGR
jgi:hypothetical protein